MQRAGTIREKTYRRARISFGLAYVAIAISFFVIGFAYLFERSIIAEQNAERLIRTQMSTLSAMAQETLAGCTQLCDELAEDECLQQFSILTLAERGQAIRQVSTLQARMEQIVGKASGMVKSVDIYFPASRSVVTQTQYFDRDHLSWFFEDYGTLTEWTMLALPGDTVWHTLSGETVGMRSVIIRTVRKRGRVAAYLLVTVDFQRMLSLSTEENECIMLGDDTVCLLTNQDALRNDYAGILRQTQAGSRFTANGTEYIADYAPVTLMDMGILVGVPAASSSLGLGRAVAVTSCVAFLVLTALLAYLYQQILRPLKTVFAVSEVDASRVTMSRALDRVASQVHSLTEQNQETQAQLGSSLPLVIGKLIARLREENNRAGRREIARNAAALGVDLEGGTIVFAVCAAGLTGSFLGQENNDIRSQKQVDLSCFVLDNLLRDLLFARNPGFVAPVDDFDLVVVQRQDDGDMARVNEAITTLRAFYEKTFGIALNFTEIMAGDTLLDFGGNAIRALDTAAHLRFWGAVERGEEQDSDFVSYFKLVRNVMSRLERGDYEGAAAVVGQIVDSLPTRVEELRIAQYRIYGLISMLAAAADEQAEGAQSLSEELNYERRLYSTTNVQDFKRETEALLLELVERRRETAVEEPSRRAVEFERYINEHYREYDLTVSSVAAHFGISESYLSRTFKQYKKCNVLEYIQELRVEAAKQLLRTETIKETARLVGFYDAQGLIRVFKRREGITPGEYKKMLEQEEP